MTEAFHSGYQPDQQSPFILAYREAMVTMQDLAATRPQVEVQYPELTSWHNASPAFTAAGVVLETPEDRQRGLNAFEHSVRMNGESHLIITGSHKDGKNVTLLLKRTFPSGDHGSSTVVEDSLKGVGLLQSKGASLNSDGKSLQFDGVSYLRENDANLTSVTIQNMYLVPEAKPQYERQKGNRLGAALRRLSGRTRQRIILE